MLTYQFLTKREKRKTYWKKPRQMIGKRIEYIYYSKGNLPPIEMIPQECLDMLNQFGGLYAKVIINGQEYSVGTCWEFKAFVHLKIKNPLLQPNQVKYTKSYMPRTFKTDDPCPVCQSMFGTDGLIPEQ
jgi:hypothetical protein